MSRYTVIQLGAKWGIEDNEAGHGTPERFVQRDLPTWGAAVTEARKLNREQEEDESP